MRVYTLQYSENSGWSARFPTVDPARSLSLCFGAASFLDSPGPISDLSAGVGAPITGCSTAGEIHGDEVHDDSLSVAVVEFSDASVEVATVPVSAGASFDAGVAVAQQLERDDLRAVFVLSDGLDVNGTELVRGLNAVVGTSVVVTGGLAGDGSRFERTWVLADSEPASGIVTAVGLYGDSLRIGHGSKGGWDRFGPERTITKSAGNVVFELDDQPILALYEQYLGELAPELPASGLLFPLALRQPGEEKQLVRTILGVDEEAQSLTFAGDMPQGHAVQLMQANFDRLIDGAENAAATAMSASVEAVSLSIAISCVGRRLVLGERTEHELEAALHLFPPGTAQVGFYSYGEISPYAAGTCDLHNQTMTLTTIGEAA